MSKGERESIHVCILQSRGDITQGKSKCSYSLILYSTVSCPHSLEGVNVILGSSSSTQNAIGTTEMKENTIKLGNIN